MAKTLGAVVVLAVIAMAGYAMAASSSATIYSFGTAVGDGAQPKGTLTESNGILFGRTTATFKVVTKRFIGRSTSFNKGVKLGGVIFSIDPSSDTYNIPHTFPASKHEGKNPRHDPMTLLNGVMYGSTLQGGKGGGTLFSINQNGSAYTKLDDLARKTGDETVFGGDFDQGTIFAIPLQ